MENAIEDVDGGAFALQAYRWEDNNCGPTAWLVMIEWVVRACGVEIEPKSLAGLAVADRGQQPGTVQSLVNFCGISVFKLRLPQDKGKKNPFLAFTFHLSMEFYLGLGEETPPTQAERLFRCMYRRKGTRNDGTLFTPQEFSVACVRLYHGGDFTAHFREYVGCVVGPLPKLLHVELGSQGLKAAAGRVTFYLEGTSRRRVVYEFSAAALSNGVHYTTIIGTRSGVVYDYDSMNPNGGKIVKRAKQRPRDFRVEGGIVTRPPHGDPGTMKWCIYRLVECGEVASSLIGLGSAPVTPAPGPLQVQKSSSISPLGTQAGLAMPRGGALSMGIPDGTALPHSSIGLGSRFVSSARPAATPQSTVPLCDMTSMSSREIDNVTGDRMHPMTAFRRIGGMLPPAASSMHCLYS